MSALLKIAGRNLIKNRRRSFYAVMAIALGFAAVNVFGGFTRYINSSLRDGFIYSMGNGHLTIFREGFMEKGQVDPAAYLLEEDLVAKVRQILAQQPEVELVTPQLYVTGILSNGQISTIFIGDGRVPSDLATIKARARGSMGLLTAFDGKPLRDAETYGVGLSAGLANLLDLGVDDGAVAICTTVEGQINALDTEVLQTFESPIELLNDKLVVMPLDLAQQLYDTRSIDRLTVMLDRTRHTAQVAERLERNFDRQGLALEIRTWEEMSPFYRKVRKMFDIIFLFLFVIVLVISAMSVINAVNQAVMERIREIGTLRALGMKREGIVALFAAESGILGLAGSAIGLLFTLIGWAGVGILRPTWVPPMITPRIPLEIHWVPEYLVFSALFLLALSILAATLPARRAVKRSVVQCLGHV